MNLLNSLKQTCFALLAGLLFVLLAALQPAFAGTPIDKTVTATASGSVHISSVAGSVKVMVWNRNQVHISGTLSAQAERLAVDTTANGVDIRVVLPRNSHGNDEGSHLVVQLPAASHLNVGTISADIAVQGLTGPLELNTVSGDIKAESASADIGAKTVSGDVGISGSAPNARIDAHSVSGDVVIRNIRGALQAGSVSGKIHVDGSNAISGAQLDATSGDIELAGTFAASGDYKFNSVSGDVTLQLQAIPAASFDASSLSGGITANFGPAPQRISAFGPGKQWHYRNGSGNAEVSIHTMSGDIRIHAATH